MLAKLTPLKETRAYRDIYDEACRDSGYDFKEVNRQLELERKAKERECQEKERERQEKERERKAKEWECKAKEQECQEKERLQALLKEAGIDPDKKP